MSPNPLQRFHPLIGKWFTLSLGRPTDVQERTWEKVAGGGHVLVTAPTGSGKTLAAFLWAINQLITGGWPRGETRVLYVSPLKALNNDVRRNLLTPLQELETMFRAAGVPFPDIAVQTRSGDTPASDRRRMLRSPPEILITTPESLNILLASRSSRHILSGIATVILDEIHAVVGSKRGTHLVTGVERLVPLCGEFQRIALSGTVRPLETVAEFVGGFERKGDQYEKRPVAVVRGERAKEFRITIRAPEEDPRPTGEDFWPRLVQEFKKIIAEHRSTLFFANSRRMTEKLTRLINEGEKEDLAYSHHGSLSREIRLAVEERLKRGELKAIVATNTLELGIDIGKLDSVVLIQSPFSISSAIQRIGRSGHGVGEVSRGLLFPTFGMDCVEAAVIARAIADHDIEPLRPVEAPLDLLTQIILSMALTEEWDLDELHAFLKTSYPYRNLSRRHFDLVIGMLEGRYADSRVPELRPRATVDRLANTIATKPRFSTLVFMEGGTIPERGYFELRVKESGARIGELDEEFVWERKIGDTFGLGAQVWQITEITPNAVEVVPARRPQQIVPFWRAEELDRDFHYSERIASFLETCNDNLADEEFRGTLTERYAMDGAAAQALLGFLVRQREATRTDLPHRHHLLVEHYADPLVQSDAGQVILHTLWGNSVNRPLTFVLAAAWEKKFCVPLQAFYTNDSIALILPRDFAIRDLFALVAPEQIETLLRASLEATSFFGARFRENAGRSLLLPKTSFKRRMPLWLNRLRSRKLLASVLKYADFPVLLETWRSCLQDDLDLPTLKRLLQEIQDGDIRVTETRTTTPSPFADGLIWHRTNTYMYQDDTPDAVRVSALGGDLIRELVFSPHLRPRLPAELIRMFESKRQRTAPGYAPDSPQDLIGWIKERFLLPAEEWSRLIAAMVRDHGLAQAELVAEVAGRIVSISVPDAAASLIGAIEMLPEVSRGLGVERHRLSVRPLLDEEGLHRAVRRSVEELFSRRAARFGAEESEEEEILPARFLGQWLSFYGPVESSWVEKTLGMAPDLLERTVRTLEETGQAVLDRFGEESTAPEICDAANLETLLRIFRRARQPAFEALDTAHLPLFLAACQGLTQRGSSLDDLRARLEQLFGFPGSAGLWEEELLPARMEPYFTAWLDSLMQTSELLWFGCGKRRLSFAFPEDLDLFREQGDRPGEDRGLVRRLIPDPNGRYSLSTIRATSGLSAAAAATELWRHAWQGELTNDSFVAVRKAIIGKFGRQSVKEERERVPIRRSRWQATEHGAGNWYLLGGRQHHPDILDREEMNKDRVRVLLDRYGILFRELLFRELPPLHWQKLFRTLRIMELSGEVLSGSFFTGIPGLQFISQDAYRLLSRGLPEDSVYWVNAADPASLCGTGLEGLRHELPPRIPASHLVYHGTRLVVVSRRFGKDVTINVQPDDPRLPDYLSFFRVLVSREFTPRTHIVVESINHLPAAESPYRQGFRAAGFQGSYKGLELWRRY